MATQLIKITHDVEHPLILYKEQPVLTFAMIDKVHSRPEGTAKRNFANKKERLINDEDFYFIDFSEKDEFRTFEISIPPRGLTVITETGYLMLVKSFTDDLAWQVQRQLVKVYFRAKQEATTPKAAEEYLTPAQYHELKCAVAHIGDHFHYQEAAQHWAWALVRKALGVEAAARIPAGRFEEARQVLKDIERSAFAFRCAVQEIERLFFRRRFGRLPPELATLEHQQNNWPPSRLRLPPTP